MRLILAAAIAALPMTALAQDDDPKAQAVKARQGFYTMLGANMGVLAGMAKGDMPYDEAQAVRAATNIEALTRYDVPMHFIEGTSTADMPGKTAAKPEIFADKAAFSEKFAGLQKAAVGIPEAVKGGQDKLGPVVQGLGGACKSCHDVYRAK